MTERTQLGEKILKDWRENRPQMVKELERKNRLAEAVNETQELLGGPPLRAGFGAAAGLSGGVGAGVERVGADARRDPPPALLAEEQVAAGADTKPSRDFRIKDFHRIGEGSLRDKTRANIEAIRALKRIEAENRDATDTERTTLAG